MLKAVTIMVMLALGPVAVSSTALAQNSAGVDEYVEELPGAGGGKPGPGADDSGGPGGGPLTPAQVDSLEELGSDGAAAAALAQAGGTGRADRAESSAPAPAEPDDDSGVAEIVGGLAGNSDAGMGVALPIILVGALAVAVASLFLRRTRRGRDPA
jgi:hypothetical protein